MNFKILVEAYYDCGLHFLNLVEYILNFKMLDQHFSLDYFLSNYVLVMFMDTSPVRYNLSNMSDHETFF